MTAAEIIATHRDANRSLVREVSPAAVRRRLTGRASSPINEDIPGSPGGTELGHGSTAGRAVSPEKTRSWHPWAAASVAAMPSCAEVSGYTATIT